MKLCNQSNFCGIFMNNSLIFFPLALYSGKVLQHQISYSQYSALGNEQLVNLAAVIMDVATQERVLASEEFNFASPVIHIQVRGSG